MSENFFLGVPLAVICFLNFLIVSPVFSETEIGIATFNADSLVPASKAQITDFESRLGRNLNSVGWYMGFNIDTNYLPSFPTPEYLNTNLRFHDGYDTKIVPMLTWEPGGSSLAAISDTGHSRYSDMQTYVTGFATAMANYKDPIRLRFGQEMFTPSGVEKWYDWQNQPVNYVNAFRKVHEIFNNNGATNVEFVWSPLSNPSDLTTLSQYYPGSDAVDWLGIDGYNRGIYGNAQGNAAGQYFSDIFNNTYETFVKNPLVFGDKKIMIAEFASIEETGLPKPWENPDGTLTFTKAQWIADAFNKIKSMEGISGLTDKEKAKIAAFYWFNIIKGEQIGVDPDGKPIYHTFDWRLDSSTGSWNAFELAMQDQYFKGHVTPEPVSSVLFLLGAGALGSRSLLKKRRKA